MLHAEDGRAYRVRLKGKAPPEHVILEDLEGKDVTLYGVVDDLRGHWRMTLDWADENVILLASVEPRADPDAGLDLDVPHAGTKAAAEIDNEVYRHGDTPDGRDAPLDERPDEGDANSLGDVNE